MKKLRFEYSMELRFSSPVSSHYFALRCIPGDSLRQKILMSRYQVTPADYTCRVQDGFGNMKISGCCAAPHGMFSCRTEGMVRTEGMGVRKGLLHPMYRYPSRYTRFEPEVVQFAEKVLDQCRKEAAESILDRAVCAMHYLYTHFEYVPGMTDIRTTAARALQIGKGVCQDYAHIMIAVMRYMNIPARYVNGLMIGEGATHAWVDVYTDGGWYGLDPTNDLHIDEYYIDLAHGRDYWDCVVDRGIFFGNADQDLEIYVNVEEIEDDRDSCINGTARR